MSLQVRGLTRFREAGPSTALKYASLRACDFFVFSQEWVLKTNDLCAKKSRKFKKVTNSQDDRFLGAREKSKSRCFDCAEVRSAHDDRSVFDMKFELGTLERKRQNLKRGPSGSEVRRK